MKEFFWNLLNNLDKMAGLKQLDKIYAAHGEDKEGAKKEIKMLLDVLCNVSSQFQFISEVEQQKIITQSVISEDFPSLNGNTVYKWLARHKDKYFKESHHMQEDKPGAEPLTGEARQAKLKEWLAALANTEQMLIAKATDQELSIETRKQAGNLEWLRNRPKEVRSYRAPTRQELEARELHLQWIAENFDTRTGAKLPSWLPEEEWLKQRNP